MLNVTNSNIEAIILNYGKFQTFYGIIVIVLGIFGNTLVVFTVYHYSALRASTKLLFVTLAFADTAVLLDRALLAWLHVAGISSSLQKSSVVECFVYIYISKLSQAMALWILCLMSLELAFSILLPTKQTPFNQVRSTATIIILLSLTLTILNFNVFGMRIDQGYCDHTTVIPWDAIVIINAVVCAFAPIFIIICLTVVILIALLKQQKKVRHEQNDSILCDNRAINATKMLLGVNIFRGVVVLPPALAVAILTYHPIQGLSKETMIYLYHSLEILLTTNNAVNFFVFVTVNQGFRQAFLSKTFPCVLKGEDVIVPTNRSQQVA